MFQMKQLSVVIPVYNEEGNIPELYRRLTKTLKKFSSYELIFVNDGSKDDSFKVLENLSQDKSVKIISFSRNFGHMAAIDAGIANATGEKVVIIDADLQDPPEAILEMMKKAKEGFDVVYGVKQKRKEDALRKYLFKSFYQLLNKLSNYKMPENAGTFCLMDKKIISILKNLPERNKYFSGLRAWTGFKQTGIVYERDARYSGKPASFQRLFKLAFDGIFSFSYFPLKLASILGFVFAIFSFLFIVVVGILRLFLGFGIVGWASLMSTFLFIGGIQLITLGIIGEYLARIYDEVKNRPEYIISSKTNL